MKVTRHIAGALVEISKETEQPPVFNVRINGAEKGTFQLNKLPGVLALVETILKTDPKQKEIAL